MDHRPDPAAVTKAVRELDDNKEGAVEELAGKILAGARADPRTVVSLCFAPEERTAGNARQLVLKLEESVVVPILEFKEPMSGPDRAWFIERAVGAEIRLRERLAKHLSGLLEDKGLLPERLAGRRVEGTEPAVRVCDRAYLELRRLTNLAEPKGKFLLTRDEYLEMEFDDRDAEIARFKKTGEWSNVLGQIDQEP